MLSARGFLATVRSASEASLAAGVAEERDELLQDEEADDDSGGDDDEQGEDNRADEYPITAARAFSVAAEFAQEMVIACVRFEPERKGVAGDGDGADEFVEQDVRGHAREDDFRQSATRGLDERDG